jgi:hypothetical protein
MRRCLAPRRDLAVPAAHVGVPYAVPYVPYLAVPALAVPAAPVVLAPLHTRGSAECPAHRPCAAPACEPCAFFPHVCALNGRPYHQWCQSCTHRRLFPDTPCRL